MEKLPYTPGASTQDLKAPDEAALEEGHDHPLAQLSSARKHFLLLIFAVAQFTDICNVSGVAIEVAQLAGDLGLGHSQLVWVSFRPHLTESVFVGQRLTRAVYHVLLDVLWLVLAPLWPNLRPLPRPARL